MLDDNKSMNEALAAYEAGDYKTALKKFKKLAFWQNGEACYYLAMMYLNGNGVREDQNRAIKYFQDGVKYGDADCAATLGDACYNGEDFGNAFNYYQTGAKQNHAYCIYKAADMLWDGQGVNQNQHLAVDYYEQAALLGQANAMTEMANCYRNGIFRNVDYNKAREWFETAADKGHYAAMYEYAQWLNEEFHDIDKAIEYYEKAIDIAEADYYALTQVCVNLGDLYKYQRNDFEAARRMYEKGIEVFEIVRSTHTVFKTADLQASQKAQKELENM